MLSGGSKKLAVCTVLAVVLLAAGVGLVPTPAAAATTPAEKADEWQMWCLVNAERRARSIPPLLMSLDLHTELARPWAQQQANSNRYYHRSDLGPATTRSVGSWDRTSENVGRDADWSDAAARLHRAYMGSTSHRTAILERRFEYVGIGVQRQGGSFWNAQNFVSTSRQLPTTALPVGQRFIDVCSSSDFFQDIRWMHDEGITTGYAMRLANGHAYRDFRPQSTVTRSQLAVFLQRVAGETGTGGSCSPYPFTDVSASDPFRNQICWMSNKGLTGEATRFLPGAAANRQAMASWMYQLWDQQDGHDFTPPESPTFTDVGVDHPYYAAIEWMAASRISTGYSDGTWQPSRTMPRQVMARFFHLYEPLL